MRLAPAAEAAALAALAAACTPDYEIVAGPPEVDPGQVTECGFTEIPGTRIRSYDCNPVFAGTGESWGEVVDSVGFHAVEVLGHPFYQIWYSARPEGTGQQGYGIGYAVSPDGTAWTANDADPLLSAQDGAWDAGGMDAIQVLWDPDGGRYVMAWQGYDLAAGSWGLGVATSPGGVAWTRHPDNPVIDFTATAEGVQWCWPLSLGLDGSGGFEALIAGHPPDRNVCQVYQASASSLDDWSLDPRPVLEAGPEDYDRSGVASAAEVELDGTSYLFYVGFRDWVQHRTWEESRHHSLDLATSPDGASWTRSADNPLPVALTEEGDVSAVAAQAIGPRIHLWVTDWYEDLGTWAVGYFLYDPSVEPY